MVLCFLAFSNRAKEPQQGESYLGTVESDESKDEIVIADNVQTKAEPEARSSTSPIVDDSTPESEAVERYPTFVLLTEFEQQYVLATDALLRMDNGIVAHFRVRDSDRAPQPLTGKSLEVAKQVLDRYEICMAERDDHYFALTENEAGQFFDVEAEAKEYGQRKFGDDVKIVPVTAGYLAIPQKGFSRWESSDAMLQYRNDVRGYFATLRKSGARSFSLSQVPSDRIDIVPPELSAIEAESNRAAVAKAAAENR